MLSEIVPPAQYGPLFDAAGVIGVALTTTLVVPAAELQLPTLTTTEYVPLFAVVALVIVGFCCVEVNEFGPVQAYVAPLTVGVLSEIVPPAQYGPVFEAVGVLGVVLTTTLVVPAAELQLPTVTMTEYVPLLAVVALVIVGFCCVEVNEFGPVQA